VVGHENQPYANKRTGLDAAGPWRGGAINATDGKPDSELNSQAAAGAA
jgi:hypothetical protein